MEKLETMQDGGFAATTHLLVVLDRSGSMANCWSDAIGGLNTFLKEQAQEPGSATLTLVAFDTHVEIPIDREPLEKVAGISGRKFGPRGSTALYDAIGQAVGRIEPAVADADRCLVLIITDGFENASREMDKAKTKALIERLQALGNWTFTYLSASFDAFADAGTIGVMATNTRSFSKEAGGTTLAFDSMNLAARRYRGAKVQQSVDFYAEPPADPDKNDIN